MIIEDYIKDAKPISSSAICKELNVSSATIRNKMVELEELSFLEKTHSSSGRIPSAKGYRYYVNNLMDNKIIKKELNALQVIFNNSELAIDDAIKKSLEIVSDMTSYTSMVLGGAASNNCLLRMEVMSLENDELLALLITDKGFIDNKHIKLPSGINAEEIAKTVELINKLLVGTPINEISAKLQNDVRPMICQYVRQYEVMYNAFAKAFSEFNHRNSSHLLGTGNFIKLPEFDTTDKIRRIVDKFADKELINSIREEKNGINIYIGDENNFDDDMAIIKMKYHTNQEEGTIAVVGPKRMEYDRVISLLSYIKDSIER